MPIRPKYDPSEWACQAFASEFARKTCGRSDIRYCFVLGAGASIQSGIQGARGLAQSFVRELHARHCHTSDTPEVWAAKSLGIPNFDWDTAETHYTDIYELRFGTVPEDGFARIEQEIEKREPSLGYSILAQILAMTPHNVVVTTNFDNLVADAMAVFTDRLPLVCGHESLAMFARPLHRRPVVAKIHRDLMFGPVSTRRGTSQISTRWAAALDELLRNYTPIFIGYGGNDGSLMGYLNSITPGALREPPIWCVYSPAQDKSAARELVTEDVRDFVDAHSGAYVAISGFDELMVEVAHALKVESEKAPLVSEAPLRFDAEKFALDKDEAILNVAQQRANQYRKRVLELASSLGDQKNPSPDALRQAYDNVVAGGTDEAQKVLRQALAEKDRAVRHSLIEAGLKAFPDHDGLLKAYGDLLLSDGDVEKGLVQFSKASATVPDDVLTEVVTPEGRVLLWVDDRPENNEALAQHLRTAGYEIRIAKSTEDAKKSFLKSAPDVIVSDMGRPEDERAGLTLCNWVRGEQSSTIPFYIYCGGWAARNWRWEALEAKVTSITSSPSQLLRYLGADPSAPAKK